jgi:glucosamine-6-phosphate deaminase
MGIRAILSARTVVCAVPHPEKAAAVRATLGGSVSPTVPATCLKTHPDATVYLDPASAAWTDPAVLALYK